MPLHSRVKPLIIEHHDTRASIENRHQHLPQQMLQLPESACIEEYNEEDQTATVHLEYISDLIELAFVEIDLKRNFLPVMKLHLIKLLPHPAS